MEPGHPELSLRRQCARLGLPRSSAYYRPTAESKESLCLVRLIDEQYTRTPFYGSRRMTAWLRAEGYRVNRKRVQRLMRRMGIEGIGPKPGTSQHHPGHDIYPYLLEDYPLSAANQVWSADITYCPLRQGFMYLVAIIDWYSRYVLSWRLSNTLDTRFCLQALDQALGQGKPNVFNTDQGCQFTSQAFTGRLKIEGIRISMDGRGRALDNVFVERLWRSVKYECLYLHDFDSVAQLRQSLADYFHFYNHQRFHQSLDYQTPHVVHFA